VSVEEVLTGPEEPPLTPEQLAIRREIRRYAAELMVDAGVSENPWVWLREVVKCINWWRRAAQSGGETLWKTLLALMATGGILWLGKAYQLWSGVGW
jgi:hypothetical protein